MHLAAFPRFEAGLRDAALEERYKQLMTVRGDVMKALEVARTA